MPESHRFLPPNSKNTEKSASSAQLLFANEMIQCICVECSVVFETTILRLGIQPSIGRSHAPFHKHKMKSIKSIDKHPYEWSVVAIDFQQDEWLCLRWGHLPNCLSWIKAPGAQFVFSNILLMLLKRYQEVSYSFDISSVGHLSCYKPTKWSISKASIYLTPTDFFQLDNLGNYKILAPLDTPLREQRLLCFQYCAGFLKTELEGLQIFGGNQRLS